jgi:aconitate hydratase
VLLKMGDDVSTDEILRAGAEALPFRSNIPEISRWAYYRYDGKFHEKAAAARAAHGGHVVVAGENYAQGSSREHAALAPRYLGQIAVLAKSYARIGRQNLINFGILPLEFVDKDDYLRIDPGDTLVLSDLHRHLTQGIPLAVRNETKSEDYLAVHRLNERQIPVMLAGGVIAYFRMKTKPAEVASLP